ncbi:MAG: hypothetical protein M1839_007036 [Geoglossum umbratile]|nr:MAG: hypothetical protein M1839_007036 [Geoglossum umbratile]
MDQWPDRRESLMPSEIRKSGESIGSLSSVKTTIGPAASLKDFEPHKNQHTTHERDPGTHKRNSDTHKRYSGTQEKDSSGRTIPRILVQPILVQPAIPHKLAFRHGSSKSSLKKGVDQEKLRMQLIEEAKQRKTLDQAALNRGPTMEAYAASILRSSGDDPSRTGNLDSHQVKPGPAKCYYTSKYSSTSSQTGTPTPLGSDGNPPRIAYGPTSSQYKKFHHEAIILSSEKMSPAKDGTVAHLGSVNILPAKARVPSFSGVIEDAGEVEPPPRTATSDRTIISTYSSSSQGGPYTTWDTSTHVGQASPLPSAAFDPTAQEFSPKHLRSDYPASLFHERHPPCGKIRVPDGKSWVSNSAGSETVYSPSYYGSSALPSPLDSPTVQLDRLDQTITSHIKDLRNHVGQARDGLILHAKAKHAASSCLVATRCDAIEAMSNKHHKEASEKLGKLSDDVSAIRSEHVDFATGLESVAEFASKMNDTFTAEVESLELRMGKKLDAVGRAVNTIDRHLNLRLGEIMENVTALHADYKTTQTALATQMKRIEQSFESMAFLRTENGRLRLENQRLKLESQKLDFDGTHMQYHPAHASPAPTPIHPANASSVFHQHPANVSNWYHHANTVHQG